MYQLNFDNEAAKKVNFRNIDKPQKKSYKRDYSSLSQTRRMIDRLMEERALERELNDFF